MTAASRPTRLGAMYWGGPRKSLGTRGRGRCSLGPMPVWRPGPSSPPPRHQVPAGGSEVRNAACSRLPPPTAAYGDPVEPPRVVAGAGARAGGGGGGGDVRRTSTWGAQCPPPRPARRSVQCRAPAVQHCALVLWQPCASVGYAAERAGAAVRAGEAAPRLGPKKRVRAKPISSQGSPRGRTSRCAPCT